MAYKLREANYLIAQELIAIPRDQISPVELAKSIAAVTRAWVESDDRVRIHRGKPLPTAATIKARAPKRRRDPGPSAESMIDTRPDSATTSETSDARTVRTVQESPHEATSSKPAPTLGETHAGEIATATPDPLAGNA